MYTCINISIQGSNRDTLLSLKFNIVFYVCIIIICVYIILYIYIIILFYLLYFNTCIIIYYCIDTNMSQLCKKIFRNFPQP